MLCFGSDPITLLPTANLRMVGLVRMLGLVRAMMDMVFLATFGLLRAMIIWLDTVFWCWALGVGVGFW
jgi:hypothetical protein